MQDILKALQKLTAPPPPKHKTFGLTLQQTLPNTITLTAIDTTTHSPIEDGNILSIVTMPGMAPKIVMHANVNPTLGFEVFDMDNGSDTCPHIYDDGGDELI